MFSRAALLAALLPSVLGYQNSYPVIAWSSHSSSALGAVSKSSQPDTFLESLLLNDAVCEHDAIVLVDHIGLHASDLRALPASSSLVRTINAAPSSLEVPYMRRSTENPFYDLASDISRRCGSRILSVSPGEVTPHLDGTQSGKDKHVLCMGMPPVEGASRDRKDMMVEHESRLSEDLANIAAAFPKHLVVYAGWNPTYDRRQFYEEDDDADFDLDDYAFPETPTIPITRKAVPSNAGILKRYQLLTPGLIVCLFVAFFVLFPVLYMSVSALASIQSSVGSEPPKGFNAVEKKNQ